MTRKYTILRDASSISSREPFDRFARGAEPRVTTRAIPEPRIETGELNKRELVDLSRDNTVLGIAPVMPTKLITPFAVTDSDAAASAWGISAVGAEHSAFDGQGVTVAVLDTGIDANHDAFAGVELIQQDFSGSGNGDQQGHGTHCAGTIFGRDVNDIRIGVARGVTRALIGKVLDDSGSGDSDMLFRAIPWAINEGANVISMSLGFDFPGLVKWLADSGWPLELATSVALEAYRANLRMFDALMDMIQAQAAFGKDAVVVAAAGNESKRDEQPEYEIAVSIPAAAEGVVSVGAIQHLGGVMRIADFSNTFPQISAPGVNILSARKGGGLRAMSGTSMACPHVAGCAALWWQAVRQSPVPPSARNVVSKLMATAHSDVFAPEVDIADRGVGLVAAP